MQLVALLVAALVVFGAPALVAALRAHRHHDEEIDGHIAANRYRYRKGMRKADHARIASLGAQRWTEVDAAQRQSRARERGAPKPAPLRDVKKKALG